MEKLIYKISQVALYFLEREQRRRDMRRSPGSSKWTNDSRFSDEVVLYE